MVSHQEQSYLMTHALQGALGTSASDTLEYIIFSDKKGSSSAILEDDLAY
jgi:hypothetical protein